MSNFDGELENFDGELLNLLTELLNLLGELENFEGDNPNGSSDSFVIITSRSAKAGREVPINKTKNTKIIDSLFIYNQCLLLVANDGGQWQPGLPLTTEKR